MARINWEKIRSKFAVTRELAYFQSAGMSPIPRVVYKTLRESYKKIYQYGDMNWPADLEESKQLGHRLGTMLGASPEDVIFMPNTSMAFSVVGLSLKNTWGQNFNLVTMADEFPASNVPFEYQGIRMKYVQPLEKRYPLELIAGQIDENTRGIVCSFVQYGTGYRHQLQAIGKLAREKGLLFIVNATQGFPIFPIDVKGMHIDVLSASLHKWGCAAHVGAMFYTSENYRRRFPAPLAGWLSVMPPPDDFIPTQKGEVFNPFSSAMQFNSGTINLQSLLGLKASFEFMEKTGWQNIRQRVLLLASETIRLLKQIPQVEILSPHEYPEEQSGIISINLKDHDNQQCVEFLEARKVITTIRQKNIRIACNFFNNLQDIIRLKEGIEAFLKK